MKPEADTPAITEADVASYLEMHPGFFEDRDNLLLKMKLPHGNRKGETISLVERQVAVLRDRNSATRQKLDELLAAAEANDAIFSKCRKLVLALVEAKDSHGFFKALEQCFRKDFKSDAYSMIVFSDYAQQINHYVSSLPESSVNEYVGGLLKNKGPYLGVLRQEEQDFLFRHSSGEVGSAAVLQLRFKRKIAILAIGNADPNYFQKGMGTLFLGFIADVIARLLPRYVYLDPK